MLQEVIFLLTITTGITKHLSTDSTDAQISPSYPYVNSVDDMGIVLRGGIKFCGNVIR